MRVTSREIDVGTHSVRRRDRTQPDAAPADDEHSHPRLDRGDANAVNSYSEGLDERGGTQIHSRRKAHQCSGIDPHLIRKPAIDRYAVRPTEDLTAQMEISADAAVAALTRRLWLNHHLGSVIEHSRELVAQRHRERTPFDEVKIR